ncbi:MAG: polyprenyl synthetase family protein [Opitutales bacterium]
MTSASATSPAVSFDDRLNGYRERVEAALDQMAPPADRRPARLHAAMRHSLLAGGKRLRPCLLLASAELFPSAHDPMPAAAAVEALHTYSLIHDDLPCMDDSELRRGRPTCHVAFDESTALLAGDALLTWALWWLAEAYHGTPELATALVRDLGDAAGSERLIGGQQEDLEGEQQAPTADRLEFIHENKTAALITACLTMGARLASARPEAVEAMRAAGRHLGLAFQIIDDVLDVTSDSNAMGKPVGADAENAKMTYPALFGLEVSRQKAREHTDAAIAKVREAGGENGFLLTLIKRMAQRVN